MSGKICHTKATSNTGLAGITETRRRGVACFSVSWRPSKGVRKCTTIYFGAGTPFTRDGALAAARRLRAEKIAERMAAEGPVKP